MRTSEIPIPTKRVKCAMCGKSLMKRGKYMDLNVCCTDGAIILACGAHAPTGDLVVQSMSLYARKMPAL